MDKAKFVYVTYISTTQEKLWNALVDNEMIKQYWGRHRNASDWQPGSAWEHQDYDDASLVDIAGKVVETSPPHRLVLTWASPGDVEDPEKTSRVTFEIEPFLDTMRLTVTHDELQPGSGMLEGITFGWPTVLSSLKTLLETGKAFESSTRRWKGATKKRDEIAGRSSVSQNL
jgi:uncharacterized protein YndB with AHSA1/START domain